MELYRQKDDVQIRQRELKKVNDYNADIRSHNFDAKIEQLDRKLSDLQQSRADFQNKLENCHSQWNVKLQLYATDFNTSNDKLMHDTKQIKDLLSNLNVVSEKQAGLLQKRQQLLVANYELDEKQEFNSRLNGQIYDTEKMIMDTQKQIQEIRDQVDKMNAALGDREALINDQLAHLNIIRQEKIDLDKELDLLNNQTGILRKQCDRYDLDIRRLQFEKEQLIARLNQLSKEVALKIDQIEYLEQLIRDKDMQIEIMRRKIGQQVVEKPMFVQLPKGDVLDDMINLYINQTNCPVPIRKIGNGFYLFGTKKIYAKILNGKLVIRVGGGYMVIEEFIATYADQEMAKIAKMSDEQLLALGANSQELRTNINPNATLSMYRNSVSRKSLTETAAKINGTRGMSNSMKRNIDKQMTR